MKKFTILFILFAVLLIISKSFAVTKISIANGNWGTASIWSPAGVPSSTDHVVITSNVYVEASYICDSLTVKPGATLTTANISGLELRVTGHFMVESGATVNCGEATGVPRKGGGRLNIFGTGKVHVIEGTINSYWAIYFSNIGDGSTSKAYVKNGGEIITDAAKQGQLLIEYGNEVIIESDGSLYNNSTYTSSAFCGIWLWTSSAKLTINGNFYNAPYGSIENNGTITINGTVYFSEMGAQSFQGNNKYFVYNSGSTLVYNAPTTTGSPELPGTTNPTNLIINPGTGGTVNLKSNVTVNGTLTLLTGNFNKTGGPVLTMGNGATINRADGMFVNLVPTFGTSCNVIYTNSSTINTSVELPISSTVLTNLTINTKNNAGVTLNANATVNSNLYLTTGNLNLNAKIFTLANNVNIYRSDGSISATPAGTSYNIIYSGINGITTGPEIPDATTVLNNLNDSNTNTVTLNKITTVNGTFLLASGSTFDISANNYALNVKKDFVNNGTFIPRNGTVTLNGTTLQNIGGNNSTTFYNLTLNNAGGISLGRNETVSNTFTMSSGSISTNANILELGTSTSNIGTLMYSSGNIITGAFGGFKRWFNDKPVSFVRFPVGTANYINMITLNVFTPTSAGSLTARFIPGSPGGSAVTQLDDEGYPYSINALSLKGYWQIDAGDNLDGGTYDISLRAQGFYPSQGAEVTNYEQLRIIKRPSSGGDWILEGIHSNATGSNTDPTMQRVGLSGFSQFAMGGSSDDGNPLDGPLPVKLTSFSSVLNGRDVKLNWVTEMEENNSGFEVQKSEYRIQESEVWNKIGFVKGNGTKNSSTNYLFEDRNLQTGKYKYRLKQIDYNGNYEYFELAGFIEVGVPAKYNLSQNYPNPFNPVTKINYDIPVSGLVTLKVYDILGKEVASLVNETREAGYYTVSFNASGLSSGVYLYRLNVNGFSSVKKFVVMK